MPREIPYPKSFLLEQSAVPRPIEQCPWFRPVQIDFEILDGNLPTDHLQLFTELKESILRQNHPQPSDPSNNSNMIIGFCDLPNGNGSLFDRVPEIDPPLALGVSQRHGEIARPLDKNYVAVIPITDDIAHLPKRESERLTRMLMVRLGAFKILYVYPEYYALGTMEGGLGVEHRNTAGAVDRLRDRLVTHACAKPGGSYKPVPDAVCEADFMQSPTPKYITDAFKQLGKWDIVARPFEIDTVCSEERARLMQAIMGYSRQSESACAVFDPFLTIPSHLRMGDATGGILSTRSGRFNTDKTNMEPYSGDIIPVAIVPKDGYQPSPTDPLSLNGFDRYALGITGQNTYGPSIEFDEMAATILYSPPVRVSRHPSGSGFIRDPQGTLLLPRVRGFVHAHTGVEEIDYRASGLVEYVTANLKDYPYPVGCGKDMTFAISTDAGRRSTGVTNTEAGTSLVVVDAMNHGTNFLILTQPLPGTDRIPDNAFEFFLEAIDPDTGFIRLTQEIAQV